MSVEYVSNGNQTNGNQTTEQLYNLTTMPAKNNPQDQSYDNTQPPPLPPRTSISQPNPNNTNNTNMSPSPVYEVPMLPFFLKSSIINNPKYNIINESPEHPGVELKDAKNK